MSNTNHRRYYLEEDQLKCHMKIVKWLCVMGIILITFCIPVYVLASLEWLTIDPLDYEVKAEANQTACSYMKQFDIQDNEMLSVCHRDGDISIDIHLFLNQIDTIHARIQEFSSGGGPGQYVKKKL